MIPYALIAGGAPSTAKGLTKHLVNNTVDHDEAKLAAYYSKGGTLKPDPLFEDVAQAVAANEMDYAEGLDVLLADWLERNPDAGGASEARIETDAILARAQEEADRILDLGIADASAAPPVERNGITLAAMEHADAVLAGARDEANAIWSDVIARSDEAWEIARDRIDDKLNAKVYALQEGVDDAPIAIIRADIDPLVLTGLGIEADRPLKRAEIDALLSGHRVDGRKIEGKTYAKPTEWVHPRTHEINRSGPIGSYDFAPAPGKDVSVAWGLGSDHEKGLIMDAHLESARTAVGYIAKQIGAIRERDGDDTVGFEPGHVGWLEFTHHTSRRVQITHTNDEGAKITRDAGFAGDPDIHTHFLIPNAVFSESGNVGSLDTAGLAGFIFEADGVYQAELAQRLRDAGFDAGRDDRTGAARIWSVPEELSRHFSKRTNMGEKLARQWTLDRGEVWDELSDQQRAGRMKSATQSLEQKTKGEKDDKADFEGWRQQAISLGWKPGSFQLYGPPERQLEGSERARAAYDDALPHLAKRFEHEAVITGHALRAEALRSLVKFGYSGLEDVAAVTKLMWKEGVQQFGEKTALSYGQEPGVRHVSVTTVLHEDQEAEFVRLGKRAAADRGNALPIGLLRKNLAKSGLDLSDDHGKALQKAIERIGTGGKFAVILAAAGAGKGEGLKPLVKTAHQRGHDVWGTSLAHEQSDALTDTGIPQNRVKPISLLLDSLGSKSPLLDSSNEQPKNRADFQVKLTKKSIIAVDEFVLLGTRQGLELLRHQDRVGFSIWLIGDAKQCEAVEAGDITDLSARVLGRKNIPIINTTKRQQTDEEKAIVGLFREGKPADALDIKRSNGDAEMVPGGREGVIKRAAELYVHYLKRDGQAPNINAPTNADAHAISVAVREERRKLRLIGETDLTTRQATDGERNYDMALAERDRVRLFKSIATVNADGKKSTLGRNKSRMEVVCVSSEGLTLKNERTGRIGTVEWGQLDHGGRTLLGYSDAQTIHTAQGSSKGTQISVLINGAQAISGGMGYSMMTRHWWTSHLLTNAQAEETAVRKARPINDPHPITEDDKWANVAKAFLQRPRDTATLLRERVTEMRRGAVVAFQKAAAPGLAEKGPVAVMQKGLEAALARDLPALKASLHQAVAQGWQAAQTISDGWRLGR